MPINGRDCFSDVNLIHFLPLCLAPSYNAVHSELEHPCCAEAIVAAFGNWKTYMGGGDLQPPILPQPRFNQSFTSARFQWLPADVVVDSSGGVKFLSYICLLYTSPSPRD